MKIISLLPIKNERWILKNSLDSLSRISDEIIILDDRSSDDYGDILELFPKVIFLKNTDDNDALVNMSEKRKKLLELGRERGGTHFIWLDADEIFSDNFYGNARELILSLKPGQKLHMKWVFLWKSMNKYRNDGVFNNLYKDFIVCDSPELDFEDKILSEGRTPGPNNNLIKLDDKKGVVIHFQYIDWYKNQVKQAWYRCSELIEGKRNAKRINNTYSITLESGKEKILDLPEKFKFTLLETPFIDNNIYNFWQYREIIKFFDKYGIEFFESLQIWHIPELKKEFDKRVDRKPKSKTFPWFLIKLNNLKNYFLCRIK